VPHSIASVLPMVNREGADDKTALLVFVGDQSALAGIQLKIVDAARGSTHLDGVSQVGSTRNRSESRLSIVNLDRGWSSASSSSVDRWRLVGTAVPSRLTPAQRVGGWLRKMGPAS
jgi:hypothetical protein